MKEKKNIRNVSETVDFLRNQKHAKTMIKICNKNLVVKVNKRKKRERFIKFNLKETKGLIMNNINKQKINYALS